MVKNPYPMQYEQLKLENQICFPVYAASRLITRQYKPLLEELEITYPQYLVLMVLWETDEMTVNFIARKLILDTNTITPLLQRMEKLGILKRKRSDADERKVIVHLTEKGKRMREAAALVPGKLAESLDTGSMEMGEVIRLRDILNGLIESMMARQLQRAGKTLD